MRDLKYRAADRRDARNRRRHAKNVERVQLHVSKGDTVKVMRGDDKGKEGKVLRVLPKTGRIVVDGVNIVKRHRKARRAEEQSGIVDFPAPIHASNVMLLDPKTGDPTRVRVRIDEDAEETKLSRRKERVSVKSGEPIARPGKQ
jgi:large subunit ribosomal protein L24